MSWKDIKNAVFNDFKARTAYEETQIRGSVAATLASKLKAEGISIREFAKRIQSSASQVQRLLHADIGGSLTLLSLVRAADGLGLSIDVRMQPRRTNIVPIKEAASWPERRRSTWAKPEWQYDTSDGANEKRSELTDEQALYAS